jgi:hypothetical protein
MIQVEKFIVTIITQSFISFLFVCVCVCVCVYILCFIHGSIISCNLCFSLTSFFFHKYRKTVKLMLEIQISEKFVIDVKFLPFVR